MGLPLIRRLGHRQLYHEMALCAALGPWKEEKFPGEEFPNRRDFC